MYNDQNPEGGAISVLEELRTWIRSGRPLVWEEADHAHPSRNGLSNKRIILCAQKLLGYELQPGQFELAKAVCLKAIVG